MSSVGLILCSELDEVTMRNCRKFDRLGKRYRLSRASSPRLLSIGCAPRERLDSVRLHLRDLPKVQTLSSRYPDSPNGVEL